MACPELAEWAGPERKRWVNRGGSLMGEEGNRWHIRFRSHPARCSLAVWTASAFTAFDILERNLP